MSEGKFQDESSESDLFDFNDRYGVRSQRAWLPYALSTLIIGGGWVLWAGLHHAEPEISHSLLAFDNSDPRNTEIRYILTRRDPSAPATCILAVRDFDKVIVGQIVDRIPPSDGAIERIVTIPSRADAVNAGVSTCYLD
jgi:hypothetical protein